MKLTLLFPALLVLLASCTAPEKPADNNNPSAAIPVKVVDLDLAEVRPVVSTSGTFTTDDETTLAFKTSGVIERMLVKEGDAIRKGQLLATLNLTEIDAQVSQANLAYEKALRDFTRVEKLYKDSVATLEQYQNARTGRDVAAKQLEAARFNRSYSEIRASGDGFVLRKLANEGQVASSGMPILVTNAASQSSWKLRVGVSDRTWASLTIGDPATVTTDALPGKSFEATVTRKGEGTDPVSGTFMVELTLNDRKVQLASGLFGKATIRATRSVRAWRIPYEALLDGDRENGYVFTTPDGHVARKMPVVILAVDKNAVLVSSGLETASRLIVSGSAYLRDSSVIDVIQ